MTSLKEENEKVRELLMKGLINVMIGFYEISGGRTMLSDLHENIGISYGVDEDEI